MAQNFLQIWSIITVMVVIKIYCSEAEKVNENKNTENDSSTGGTKSEVPAKGPETRSERKETLTVVTRKFTILNEKTKQPTQVPLEFVLTDGDLTVFKWEDYVAIGQPDFIGENKLERVNSDYPLKSFHAKKFKIKVELPADKNQEKKKQSVITVAYVDIEDKQRQTYSVIGKHWLNDINQHQETVKVIDDYNGREISVKFTISTGKYTSVTSLVYIKLGRPLTSANEFECRVLLPPKHKIQLRRNKIYLRASVIQINYYDLCYMGWEWWTSLRNNGYPDIFKGYYTKEIRANSVPDGGFNVYYWDY